MILKKIVFKNFRQFYGEQSIEFAGGDKNVTIIFGENGKGKTGIFRGLIFSIFGDRYLGQDNTSDDIHLVNLKLVDESTQGVGEAKVTTSFEHDGQEYTISREILASKVSNNKIDEREGSIRLDIVDIKGNSLEPITDPKKINEEINNVINRDVKDFFFFDGEKIETFAKTNKGIRKEIKNGIIKLLNIEDIDDASSLVAILKSKEERRITTESANNNLIKINKGIEEKKETLIELLKREEENEKEQISCEKEIDKHEEKLLENNEIKSILKNVESIKEKLKEKKKTIGFLKASIKERSLKQLASPLLENELVKVTNYLQNAISKNENIADIAVLKKIFSDQRCICGTELLEGNLAFETIKNLIKNHKRSFTREVNTVISETHEDIKRNKENSLISYDEIRRELRRENDELEKIRVEKEKEENKIKDLARNTENLSIIEGKLEEKKVDYSRLRSQALDIKSNIKYSEKELEILNKKYKEAINQDSSLKYDKKKLEKLDLLVINFKNLLESYTEEMRGKLIKETTRMFKELIDSKDEGLISKIDVNENYELDFYNWNNYKINQDISQGQRQVVALSFITSLAKLASKNEQINFPLFMDTPFGRMSGNNRDNIIKNIPNLTSQWVPLLTDTELSVTEEIRFQEYGKVGKKYILEQLEEGKAKIIEVSIDQAISKRR